MILVDEELEYSIKWKSDVSQRLGISSKLNTMVLRLFLRSILEFLNRNYARSFCDTK